MTRFQLIFTAILVALGVAGVVIFAISKNSGSQSAAPLVMWGNVDKDLMTSYISGFSLNYKDSLDVNYVQKSPATFESDLISALANGNGPDLVLLPQGLILKQINKFYVVPFSSYSQRTFMDSFIPEGELFLTSAGIIGFPFSIDPMVMYWNRDMFSNAGIPLPPTTWSQFFDLAPKLTVKDQSGNITQSAIAFGEAENVTHFKDMVALLSLQAGTPIVALDSMGTISSAFSARGSQGLVPAEEAVSYFTEFSNPLKTSYSWNRSLPDDKSEFLAGQLAVYFGYASELRSIRAANPNLNFDVALMPQTEGKKETFGAMDAVAILKASKNIPAAYVAAVTLASQPLQAGWVSASGLPPVRRDMLAPLPGNAYDSIFYQSALISNAWLDPNREETTNVFGSLIDDVTSGKLRVSDAVSQASQQIGSLLRANNQ